MIVKDLRTLKAMERRGLVTLHEHTGKDVYWNGHKGKAWYVDDCQFTFQYKGKTYRRKYIDGSFNPYVEEVFE